MGNYHTAQVCLNGHLITGSYEKYPEDRQKFCRDCGAKTITECPSCGNRIHGTVYSDGWIDVCKEAPAYCVDCGHAFPWTQVALEAASELIREAKEVDPEAESALVEALPYIISDTPRTSLAVFRIKRFIAKAGPAVGQALRDLLVAFVTEAAKKGLGW